MDLLFALVLERLGHFAGDFALQNGWMAFNKLKSLFAATVHGLAYGLGFVLTGLLFHWIGLSVSEPALAEGALRLTHWRSLLVIASTHILIDRFALASIYYRFYNGFLHAKNSELEPWQKSVCLQIDQGFHHVINVIALITLS